MSGFRLINTLLSVFIPPSFLGDLRRGIFSRLERLLLRYVDKLDGVVISFSDVKILDDGGKIINDQPEIHFRIRAKFLIFSPKPGQKITGVVSNVAYDHIGLIVFGIFSAAIPTDVGEMVDQFELGSSVEFEIKNIRKMRYSPGIKINGAFPGAPEPPPEQLNAFEEEGMDDFHQASSTVVVKKEASSDDSIDHFSVKSPVKKKAKMSSEKTEPSDSVLVVHEKSAPSPTKKKKETEGKDKKERKRKRKRETES